MLIFMACGCFGAHAETSASVPANAPQKQKIAALNSLSIFSPEEIFVSLKETFHPNWVTLFNPATAPVTTDRTQLALALGVLAANGSIAIQAQDGQQVKNVDREMMSLARALGLNENLMGRGNSLSEFAEKKEWDSLAAELEVTENQIKRTMIDQKDEDLVTLTSAASWLRRMEVATQVVLESQDMKRIAVIRHPEVARRLGSQLDSLPERMKKGSLVSRVRQTLEEIATLLETLGATPATRWSALRRIHEEIAQLIKEIMTSPGGKPLPSPSPSPAAPATDQSKGATAKP